jgi:hypothetical protein
MAFHFASPSTKIAAFAAILCLSGCGGSSNAIAPIVLTVAVNAGVVVVIPGGSPVYVPVTVMAPTETVTFAISGLPAGAAASYRESESNPSGQLTLTANASTPLGSYKPIITVGSSGQTASTTFSLTITAPAKSSNDTSNN